MKHVAILGCGNISGIYLKNLSASAKVKLWGVCDLLEERAKQVQQEYQVPKLYPNLEAILADKQIDLVVNLTTPPHHYRLNKQILETGKSVYCEKPLALSYAEAQELADLAQSKGLELSAAPDTFLGDAFAHIKKQIDSGIYGKPISAVLNMLCPGHESWHPDPEFYYQTGGGPLWDMGPYYLTAITYLFGSVCEVGAAGKMQRRERMITSQPRNGQIIQVEVDTHITAILKFTSGFIANLTISFDIVGPHQQPNIQIYFEEGIVQVPDPNTFGSVIPYFLASDPETGWQKISLMKEQFNTANQRGRGVEELLCPPQTALITAKRPVHIVELMEKICKSCQSGQFEKIESRVE